MTKEAAIVSDKLDKLFDVAHPGKTPAGATSRPIIVRHNSSMKSDPMVVDSSKEPAETVKLNPIQNSTGIIIEVPESNNNNEDTPLPEPAETLDEVEAQSETDGQSEGEPVETSPVVDSLVGEVSAKQADKRRKQALVTQSEAAEKSIATKEFFVPIGLESRRRSNMLIIVFSLALIVITVLGLNFAIDAELIDAGFKPLTDLL